MELQHFSHEHPLIFTEEYGKDYVDDDNDNEHPEHPLTLSWIPQEPLLFHRCHFCKAYWIGFAYSCSVCNFDNDIICAQKPQIIKHTSHKHPMTPLLRTMLFSCDACGLEHEDMSYLCHTCQFWIHESCASLPNTVKHFDHDHPLTLCYSFPREFDNFVFCCDICSEYLDKACWIYSCVGCRCYGHLNCAIAATAASQEEQFRLVWPRPLLFWIRRQRWNFKILRSVLFPFQLSNDHYTQNTCSLSSHKTLLVLGSSGVELVHFFAMDLPTSVPLAHSTSMPRVVPYWALSDTKLTKHHLLPENFPWACNACHVCSPLLTFGCETCGFNLHIRCALWLRTIRHRYDEHPYSLNYVPVKDHLAEYYCEVCCYKLNPKNWFYHCDECDQSIHCECIISLHDELSNIKFGGTIEADCHLHLVTFVQKETDDSSCQIIRSARVLLALNVPSVISTCTQNLL
ncbi:uncharacterized protein LOC114307668 [Camellia sinensis]|uniref:uncharacterized protein LOC114307668 n=1 Tax=Camellia sinensis TaxID=4442 RepID=UPI0010364998|nr:uncharacterized protein LOC114307668 [Camellia sinensis]